MEGATGQILRSHWVYIRGAGVYFIKVPQNRYLSAARQALDPIGPSDERSLSCQCLPLLRSVITRTIPMPQSEIPNRSLVQSRDSHVQSLTSEIWICRKNTPQALRNRRTIFPRRNRGMNAIRRRQCRAISFYVET